MGKKILLRESYQGKIRSHLLHLGVGRGAAFFLKEEKKEIATLVNRKNSNPLWSHEGRESLN